MTGDVTRDLIGAIGLEIDRFCWGFCGRWKLSLWWEGLRLLYQLFVGLLCERNIGWSDWLLHWVPIQL